MREGEEFNPAAELAYLRAKTRYSQSWRRRRVRSWGFAARRQCRRPG